MTDYDPTEAQRLIGWCAGMGALVDRLRDQLAAAGVEIKRIPDLQAAIGYEIEKRDAFERERDSLHAEVERWRIQLNDALAVRDAFKNERDSLRAEVERLRLLVDAGMESYAELESEHGLLRTESAVLERERDTARVEREVLRAEVERLHHEVAREVIKGDDLQAEVDQTRVDYATRGEHVLEVEDAATSAERERDSLRAEVERLNADGLELHWRTNERNEARAERDSLRQQLEAAQAANEDLRASVAKQHAKSEEWRQHYVSSQRCYDAAQRRIAELERACDAHAATADDANDRVSAARRRIAELEAERDTLRGETAEQEASAQHETEQLTDTIDSWSEMSALYVAALRAILPVYRAGEAWSTSDLFSADDWIIKALDTARAAITPEIAAVLAGLERGE